VAKTANLESRKWKARGRGGGPSEPSDVAFGRSMVGKVGNSKKVVLGETRRFGQVWTEMVVFLLPFFASL
jgi:hypothetical protein